MRKALDWFNGILMVLMFLTIFIQIAAREIFSLPTTWSAELGIMLFTFIVFYGLPCITRERTHLRVDALYQLFPKWGKTLSDLACGFVYIAFFLYLAWGAYENAVDNWDVQIPTFEICHLGWVYAMMLLATVIHIAFQFINIYEDGRQLLGGGR